MAIKEIRKLEDVDKAIEEIGDHYILSPQENKLIGSSPKQEFLKEETFYIPIIIQDYFEEEGYFDLSKLNLNRLLLYVNNFRIGKEIETAGAMWEGGDKDGSEKIMLSGSDLYEPYETANDPESIKGLRIKEKYKEMLKLRTPRTLYLEPGWETDKPLDLEPFEIQD